ncbi:tRNA (guanine(6)-N2)-methyltransferase THUMP3-like [Watersipora subatra]|uniref:tRNA (guanine(6)-N2)-methyltransferase THUMP3-like n=1 Tax=Watersipora subatra TaxID=2589382 RepID=UPI00355B3534
MLCTVRASVATGLEFLAAEEVKEKLSITNVEEGRGYICWKMDSSSAKEALTMKIIDHVEIVMSRHKVHFSSDSKEAIEQLAALVPLVDWKIGLEVWSSVSDFGHHVSELPATEQTPNMRMLPMPRYRATCYRTGAEHKFSSPEVSHRLGGVIQDRFGWQVNLTDFDIEVVISIVDEDVTFGMALTKKSLYHRNVSQFAKTTLKANISAALLRLANIQAGDVVLDPMCGSGSITLEGAVEHPKAFHMAADEQEYCVECTRTNILALDAKRQANKLSSLNAGVMRWDATNLPLQTASINAIVTDLPFGKRMGTKTDNRKLYPLFLVEAARITIPGSGRAILLSADKNCMRRVLPKVREWWVVPRTTFLNHGGIRSCIYVLRRTAKIW